MRKNSVISQSNVFNPRAFVAFSLCSAAALLAMFSFATPPSEVPYPRPGVTLKMSAANAGANSSQVPVAVSTDGRYVAFQGNFGFGCCVVGIYDRQTGVTDTPAVSDAGGDARLSLSADGRYLAYATPGYDSNGIDDVYVLDRHTGTNTWISVAPDGSPPTCTGGGCVFSSWYPSISADGRHVAFYSFASNLVSGDTNQTADVFVRDMQTGITERVSVASGGTEANGLSVEPSISADGRYVAFRSFATNLVSGNTNTGTCAGSGQTNPSDIYLHDRQTGVTELVSVGIGGTQDGCSWGPSISADGRYVAFTSAATTLIPVDSDGVWDVFVRDRQTGRTERVSVSSDGAEGTCGSSGCDKKSHNASLSPDGRYVVFASKAWNLDPRDTNQTGDIFVHDRETGATERVSVATDGTQGNNTSGPNVFVGPAISGDGRIIAFDSFASNLVPNDTNNWDDVFMRDRGPAVGIGVLNASCSAPPPTASGWATFSGGVISRVDDPSSDASTGAAQAGAELIGASLAYRPEHADLFVRFGVSSLPSKGAVPGVLYGFKITVGAGGIPYEVRAAQGESMGSPLFALYNCQSPTPTCTQVAVLSGSMGTTGNEVTVSVPLTALGATQGTSLTGLDAYTAFGSVTAGPAVTLDDDPLPSPTTIPVHSVTLGIAPAGTPETNVGFNTPATLANGFFSGSLPPAAAGSYDVWAKACLGNDCGAASVPLTVAGACAAPPVQLVGVVSRKVHGSAGTFDIDLPFTPAPPSPPIPSGIECRSGGPTSDYTIVFTFLNPVTNCGVPSTGSLSSGPNPNQCTVNLTGVADAQYITVTLTGAVDSTGAAGNVSGTMGVLIGDVNATRLVDGNDVSLVQGQARQTANSTNFRLDVNTTGLIDGNDVSLVQSETRTSLP